MSIRQLQETISEAYSRVAEDYDRHYTDPVSVAENELVFSFLGQAPPEGRLIDLGCGTGLALDHLSIPPERYAGVDISVGMLRVARKKHPGYVFLEADMTDLPFEDGSFDAAVSLFGPPSCCTGLLCLKSEVHRVLRPGGIYFLMFCALKHKSKGAACIIEEADAEGLMRSHYSAQYVRANFRSALVFGMTTRGDYEKRDPDRQDAFLTHNLIRGLITPDDSLYLIAYGTKDSRADVSTHKFICPTWRGDPLSISKHLKKTG